MIKTYALRQSTHQFRQFSLDILKKDDHLGVRNSYLLENIVDGEGERSYYFQTRNFGNIYLSLVCKLVVSDQTWNTFLGSFIKDNEIDNFIKGMIFKQEDRDLLGLIGNNLPQFPEIIGLIVMGEAIYKV
tara:strand:- start:5952 stop:6341 length:390 start_codon:yes stop_codon:yes gene_type:complete